MVSEPSISHLAAGDNHQEGFSMKALRAGFDRIDKRITRWMARYGVLLLRVSLGVVFLWFGILKFFPGLSPAQGLATQTIDTLTMGRLSPGVSLLPLAPLGFPIPLRL